MTPARLYRWRVRSHLPERFGEACRLLATGSLNSALVEFLRDGRRVVTSRFFVRRVVP